MPVTGSPSTAISVDAHRNCAGPAVPSGFVVWRAARATTVYVPGARFEKLNAPSGPTPWRLDRPVDTVANDADPKGDVVGIRFTSAPGGMTPSGEARVP